VGRVVEKECGRCKGVGYSRMPASAAYRAVTMLIPNLTQPTWSRTVKPLYDALAGAMPQRRVNRRQHFECGHTLAA
jgi:hypothetical protein